MSIQGYTFRQLIDEVLSFQFAPNKYESLVKTWLNSAQQTAVIESEMRLLEAAAVYTTSSGDATLELPSDFNRLIDLHDEEEDILLSPIDLREYDTLPEARGRPEGYAVGGNEIILYPSPAGTYKIGIRYWRLPAEMVADEDEPEIPKQYHDLLIAYAMQRAYLRENDYSAAATWGKEWETGMLKMRGQVQADVFDGPRQVAGSWGDLHEATPLIRR